MIDSRDVSSLRADVAANCRTLVEACEKRGLPVLIVSTLRDNEYQAALYAQGRTRSGSIVTNAKTTSFHGCGCAFDFCKNIKGHEYDDPAFFEAVAAIAKGVGFSWGGDWKSFPDKPHLQWDEKGKYTDAMIRAGKTPAAMPVFRDEEDEDMVYYKTIGDVPQWYRASVQKCIDKGALTGDDKGVLNVSEDFCRTLTVLDRLGRL